MIKEILSRQRENTFAATTTLLIAKTPKQQQRKL
jgi:hypothetical protein